MDGEFSYGAPLTSTGPAAAAAITPVHPHDRLVFGAVPAAPSPPLSLAPNGAPALRALIERVANEPTLRSLVFAATSLNKEPAHVSPPPTARPTKDGKKPAKPVVAKKKDKDAPVITPEEVLVNGCDQSLLLYLREHIQAREDFAAWKKDASVTALPLPPASLDQVDTRLYRHLLNEVSGSGSVDVGTMLYAMFEQVAVTAPSGRATKPQPQPDLDDFFAGQALGEVDAFMAAALERVSFNAHAPASGSSAVGGWVEGKKAPQGPALGVAADAPPMPFLKHDDSLGIRRAECALALGLPLMSDSISLAAEKLLADFLPLPGVVGKGMPPVSTAEQQRQGMDATQLFQRATQPSLDGEEKLSAAVFERALLLLDLEEMLLQPAPEWKHTVHAALDETQATDVNVLIHPLPGSKAALAQPQPLPAVKNNRVKERRPGSSLYHTAHARLASGTVESAVAARLRELHAESKKKDPAEGGFGVGFGLRDASDAADDQRDWELEKRVHHEELDARVLPQRLLGAMFSPLGASHTQVRYRAMFDDLLVAVHTPTPLRRERTALWAAYFAPDLSLDLWLQSNPSIQRLQPAALYEYADRTFSGKLAHRQHTLFPADQGRLAVTTVQWGDVVRAFVCLEKEDSFLTLERVSVEEVPFPQQAPVATPPPIVLADEEPAPVTSRPTSREGTSRKGAKKDKEKEKEKAKDAAAAPAGATTPKKAPTSASAKKKAQAEEVQQMEELTACFTNAQAELVAAREAEASGEAEASAAPSASKQAVLFSARFADGTRFTCSGKREDASNRVTYTTRTGLVVELRGTADQVLLKYPRSVLDGGKEQPLLPAATQTGACEDAPLAVSTAEEDDSQLTGSLLTSGEDLRVVSPDGIIYRVSHEGAAWLLLPNGHVAYRPRSEVEWVWTDNAGVRSQRQADGSVREVEVLQVSTQYDAESGATVVTRADLTMFIAYADGSSLAQHAEGSRIYTDVVSEDEIQKASPESRARKHVTVEAPRFPPLSFKHSMRTDLRAAAETFAAEAESASGVNHRSVVDLEVHFAAEGATLTKTSVHDCVLLSRRTGEYLLAHPQGRVVYVPRGLAPLLPEGFLTGAVDFEALPVHIYDFDLAEESGAVRVRDNEDSVFRVDCLGAGSVVLGRERNFVGGEADSIPTSYYPLPANPAQPRLFVVRADGSGFELLQEEAVKAFVQEAEQDPLTKILPAEPLDTDERATSLQYLTTLQQPQPYLRHPVIPNVVRAAPSALAAGSSLAALSSTDPLVVLRGSALAASPIAPPASVVYRQLLALAPLSPSAKARAHHEKAEWADWKEAQQHHEMLYRLDAERSAERSQEQLDEEARVQREIQAAREGVARRKQQHAQAVESKEAQAADPTLAASARSRPSTANAHRQASSSALLPRPMHEATEGTAVVQQMVATLTAPPKTFFQAKGAGPVKTKASASRPVSAATTHPLTPQQQPSQVTPEAFAGFFAHPSFRRDFLLSALLQRLTDLASPFIQGSREREEESAEAQTAAEKEELWASLDAEARATYQAQFTSQLSHLVSDCLAFTKHASAFLAQPYNAAARCVQLQQDPYLSLVTRSSPHFASIVSQLAAVLGFEPENERLVLTAKDDATFRENLAQVTAKLKDLEQSATDAESIKAKRPASGSASKRAPAEEKEAVAPSTAADLDGGDHVDYDAVMASLTAAERAAYMSTPAYQQYLAREARLKAIPSTFSTQTHAPHGASFQYTSPFVPRDPFYPPQPPRTSLPANPHPTAFDVTGAPRRGQVQLPAAMGAVAPAELNQRHLMSELQSVQPPRSAPKTASTAKQTWHTSTAPFASFVLQPAALDLGPVRKGCTYRATVALTNTGHVAGRFRVQQPNNEERGDSLVHTQVLYRPGLVAAGLQRRLEVELYAGSVGDHQEEIVIHTEQHVFRLPLTASILPDSEYSRVIAGGQVGAADPLLKQSFATSAVQAPQISASYADSFPTSPLARSKTKAGPFALTSTFAQPTTAGPQFSKAAASPAPAMSRSSFGSTGEVRLISTSATPHVQYKQQQQQARRPPPEYQSEI